MRKFCFSLIAMSIILLMVSPCFAQTARSATSSPGKSNFTNIGIVGLNQPRVPGYIELTNTSGNVYYIWIGADEKLHIASELIMGYLASPALLDWIDSSGPVVGPQDLGGNP